MRIAYIAANTFREAVRDRVLYNLIIFAFLMIGASLLLGQITIGVERELLVNLGLTAISIFGVLIAIFIGIGLVSKEIDKRTVYTVLTRPVQRWQFILGKYFGLVGTLGVNTFFMAVGLFAALLYVARGLSARRSLRSCCDLLHSAAIHHGDVVHHDVLVVFDADRVSGNGVLFLCDWELQRRPARSREQLYRCCQDIRNRGCLSRT